MLTKPPKLVYSGMKTKVGAPKDYAENVKEKVFDSECARELVAIPKNVIQKQAIANGEDDQAILDAVMQEETEAEENGSASKKASEPQEYYTPIKALSTFIYDWRIKARLVKKGPRKEWKNSRSEGYFFNIELMDCHGTMIQATFFKTAADKFDPVLKEGNIYLCSGGTVKLANQRFATVKNDFCIVFDNNAEITEVADDTTIEQKGYNFVKLDDIQPQQQLKIIDFVGVLVSVGACVDIQTRSGEIKTKRVITIADDSGLTIECCVWAKVAHSFDGIEEADPVIALKGCRITDFQGISLQMDQEATYELNPDIPAAKELRAWFKSADKAALRPLNQGRQNDALNSKMDKSRLIAEMNDMFSSDPAIMHQLQQQSSGANYFTISGHITFVKNDEKAYYLACPNEDCRRKVQENDGTVDTQNRYRCDSCNRGFDECQPTYMLLAKIADFSDSVYVNFYRQQAETIMRGVSAARVKELREAGELDQLSQLFYEAQWQHYTFTVQSKFRQFNDDMRLNFACIRATPNSFAAENRQLVKRLQLYEKMLMNE